MTFHFVAYFGGISVANMEGGGCRLAREVSMCVYIVPFVVVAFVYPLPRPDFQQFFCALKPDKMKNL